MIDKENLYPTTGMITQLANPDRLYTIEEVKVSGRAMIGYTGPQNIDIVMKTPGGKEYTAMNPVIGLSPFSQTWTQDPNGGGVGIPGAWSDAALNAMEIGIKTKT